LLSSGVVWSSVRCFSHSFSSMSSLWARTFSCCIRARSSHVGPHERTPLIRDTEYAPTPPLPRVIDHQRMKERLGNIVRSKEDKMVNVNAQIPFNLHNQNLGQRLDPSSSRSARSRSGGANADYSSENSRRPSPSPAPSLQISRSSTSLHPGDVASAHFSVDHEPRKPLLNVRLVRGVGKQRASGSGARGRLGRFGDDSAREVYVGDGSGSSQQEVTHEYEHHDGQDDAEDVVTPRPPDQIPRWATLQEASVETPADALAPKPPSPRAPEFKFQEAGVISRSWGD